MAESSWLSAVSLHEVPMGGFWKKPSGGWSHRSISQPNGDLCHLRTSRHPGTPWKSSLTRWGARPPGNTAPADAKRPDCPWCGSGNGALFRPHQKLRHGTEMEMLSWGGPVI